ncbi:hypothetical protein BSKO_03305 [Bryopsis sp. KO-2023]|nr:hypothetical protein BSKO_03305 [Bryopsis sp. KO-2023]
MAERLLDFAVPLDVGLLERTVDAFHTAGNNEQRGAAEAILRKLQEHPDAWRKVDQILKESKSSQTKFFALQILESLIKYRWGALPEDQREGIKNFISTLVVNISSTPPQEQQAFFMRKLDAILVEILKHDWPHRWKGFIPELVAASRTSEVLCENSMHILRLLSEEIFDFSRGALTQAKIKELKSSLNDEFRLIHELCHFVLNNSQCPSLIQATLSTLHAYLSWVPLGYIFQGNMVEKLLQLFAQPPFRNLALQCLTEIGSLNINEFGNQFVAMYRVFMGQLMPILPQQVSIANAYENGKTEDQKFIQNLALFFTGFFKSHELLLESTEPDRQNLLIGLQYLVHISYVDDVEVFKTCLDYWNYFVMEVYNAAVPCQTGRMTFYDSRTCGGKERRLFFESILSQLRTLMLCRMAKPEEVIVVEDENGNAVRETMKDSEVLAQYKTMRETLIYLSNLDQEDTERQMLDKLRAQLKSVQNTAHDLSWTALHTLCWAIGSVSGTMQEDMESRFLVSVIRDLLSLCELTRGKNNKAIIASCIMYVVGQYPKFLRAHWKFLKTVVNKLFEFMHEMHPGVQDMACDTFLKICNKCKKQFVIDQQDEPKKFIVELLEHLTETIRDLQPHQVNSFYESVGLMISSESNENYQVEYLMMLMSPPNAAWKEVIAQASANIESLKSPEILKKVQNCLQANTSVCQSLGDPFDHQMKTIYVEMLEIYKQYSELISKEVSSGGPYAAKSAFVRAMRSVKRSALKLLETLVESMTKKDVIMGYVPRMLDPILGDYNRNVPDARDPEVLSLFATIIRKLQSHMADEVPRVFEAVFECTLNMITKNFEDYPDHRLKFFALLHAITNHCFKVLFAMSPGQLQLVMDSIVWAFRHTERNVAETGLNLLEDLLHKFQESGVQVLTGFHRAYFIKIMQEILVVMADGFHKPGFKQHAKILHHLFTVVQMDGAIQGPLWDQSKGGTHTNNATYIREFVEDLLTRSFPNLTAAQVMACVAGMFDMREFPAFKSHLRDFLVQTKQFASQDNAELYAEEAAAQREAEKRRMAGIPGMLLVKEETDM